MENNKKGNPIASMRFRAQSWTIDDDMPYESEWFQLMDDAIKYAKRVLKDDFHKAGNKNLIVIKIFNEMNYKQPPVIIKYEQPEP